MRDSYFYLKSVSAQFSMIAEEKPRAVAIVDGDGHAIDYGTLNSRAKLLAASLQQRGVEIEDSIGLLLDRSIELYIGMLAIHKCGACYVPLDPTWPGKRHEFIVADTKCKIILTTSKQPIPPFLKDKTILLDQFDWTSALPSKTVFPELDLDSIAYILYTSGSTGTPKGVEVQHDGLANFVLWQNTIFPHTGEYRMTQAARPSFDASCSEIWPAFCCGATLYIIPESLLLHISELAYWLFDKKIDECFLPTPLAELLMENGMPPHSSLKLLRTGGERLMGKPPKGFPAPILNEYGPTECSIVSTYSIYYPGDSREPLPDIGVAIQDMAVHILDEDLQPLPVGKPGEICISGIGLARGYHNRPDLDAVAFVKNPKNPSERLYRTGDIGIQTYEDRFDFVDRKDFQVKLRGQRIELGEIEKVILSHPDVKKSIALMRESKSGGKYIAVYITVKDNRTDIKEELLKLSQESLPEYMIPSTISVLESFPLTERGKVDRDAFPEPDQDETKWEAPKGNVEKKLSILWQKQLNSSPPGREDHFFRLGGDSLSAAILSVRIGEEFNFDSCAELLFEYPKLMDLAAFVEKKAGTGTKIGLSREKEDAARMLFPATSYQVAQWKLQTYSDAGNLNNIVMMIHIRGNVDLIRFQQVLTRIVQNNAAFRSGFSWNGKHLMQRVMPELSVEMPFHNWVAKSSTLQQQLLKQELGVQQNRCFNLDSPPLFYAKLIQIEDQRYEFIFTVCHLIFDGWSGALFLTELRDNYDRLASHLPLLDKAQELPDYPDFAIQHQKMLHSGFFTEGLAAWEKMLESFTPMPKLPFEHADSEINYNAAGRYQMTIPEGLCSRLRAFAENSGSTLFTLLQAVLQIQLHKYTGAVDIVTGTAVANRRIRNSENMIGMFINSLPVRHHCNPEKSFNSFFESFHYTIMQCKKYSDVPLDLIVDHLNISSKKTPLFTVSLLLQNLPWPENDSAKLEMGYDEYGSGIAKTDITLVMEERGKTLDCHVEFREALFSQNVIEEFCAGFLTLATTLLDAPEIPITTLSCPSPMGTRPGAYVLGDTGVVPACGDVLLKSGFYIHGVLSSDPIVLDWAKKERIPCESLTGKTLQAVLTRIPFDYLFSIINGCILKENILKLPRKMAINYHDSPLPRYAGLNACSWAVVNGEKTHGITWHRMNEKIDAGEILKQRIFPVPVNATATQLSLKCSEECVAAFSELAEELFNGTQTLTVPDRSQYTCFPSSRRPFAGGMMDWRKTSEELCALVRGLVFELYDNELTCPKFVYHGTLIIVGDAQVVDSKKNHAPGIITERGDQTITVSSGNGFVKLGKMRTISGEEVDLTLFNIGENLTCDCDDLSTLDKHYLSAARNEGYWIKIFAVLEMPQIPIYDWNKKADAGQPVVLPEYDGVNSLALFLLFMANLMNREQLYLPVKLVDESFDGAPQGFLLEYLSVFLDIDFHCDLKNNIQKIENSLNKLYAHSSCPGDLLLRRKRLHYFSSFSPALELKKNGPSFLVNCTEEQSKKLLGLFQTFYENVMAHPEFPLKKIGLLSPEEFQKEVFVWNDNSKYYNLNRSYANLFEERMWRYPDKIAMVAGKNSMTYRQLNLYASRIANILFECGVASGDVVGIIAKRTPEFVAAILGIFKMKCAYFAVEPGLLSMDNQNAKFKAGGVKVLLSFYSDLSSNEKYSKSLTVIDLNDNDKLMKLFPSVFPQQDYDGNENAYLMFTSGSTGEPKGVMISQRNLLNHNLAVIERFHLTSDDRVLQFGSLSFDLSVEEIFPILLVGGTLVFRAESPAPPMPGDLLNFARRKGVSVLDLPTAYWHNMIATLRLEDVPTTLRLVIIGGERASEEHLRRWRELAPKAQVLNTYGPTETTVIATASEDVNTIGTPIHNVKCYILDRFMRPCPAGCSGEIYIGGEGVGKGYINDSQKTTKSFVQNPFVYQERLYRTRDLGCYTPDGRILYIGRADRQIKLRGYRIELDHVESAMRQLPSIHDAAVVVHHNLHTGGDRLDGYVTASFPGSLDLTKMKLELGKQLPKYMVPATITVLSQFSLNSSGKLDRKALPIPQEQDAKKNIKSEPVSILALQLSVLFKRILRLDSVDPLKSFFDLGGDSLSALNFCLEVEQVCGIKLKMEEFYRYPSINSLKKFLENKDPSDKNWKSLVLLADNGPKRPVFLFHSSSGEVFNYVHLASLLNDRRVYAFQAYGLKRGNEPHYTISEMVDYYLPLLRQQQPHGPYYLCGWCFGGFLAYEMARRLIACGEKVAFLGLIDTWSRSEKTFSYYAMMLWNLFKSGPHMWQEYLQMKYRDFMYKNTKNLDNVDVLLNYNQGKDQIKQLKRLSYINIRSVNNYFMRYYPGTVYLFCAEKKTHGNFLSSSYLWTTKLVREIHLKKMNNAEHNTILKMPAVEEIAKTMNAVFVKADQEKDATVKKISPEIQNRK